MNLSKYITFQSHHEGIAFPDTSISFGLTYNHNSPKKASGVYIKFILPKVELQTIISPSTFEHIECKCRHNFIFRIRKNRFTRKFTRKFNFSRDDAWIAI